MGWVLRDIEDFRIVDFATGRVLSALGEVCDACGAEHDQLYLVEQAETGRSLRLGPDCVAGACSSWSPSPKAIELALASVRAHQAEDRGQVLDVEADTLAAKLPKPPRGADLRQWVKDHAGDEIQPTWLPEYVEDLITRSVRRLARRRR